MIKMLLVAKWHVTKFGRKGYKKHSFLKKILPGKVTKQNKSFKKFGAKTHFFQIDLKEGGRIKDKRMILILKGIQKLKTNF